ncbi:MAG: hypothetical protein ACX930_11545 [Erythrobacter sp.]
MKFAIAAAILCILPSAVSAQEMVHQEDPPVQVEAADQEEFLAPFDPFPKILAASTSVRITRAYWAGNSRWNDRVCRAVPQYTDYVYVEHGAWRDAGGRGTCQVAPYCDSHGERCQDYAPRQACYVRRDFVPWLERQLGHQLPPESGGIVRLTAEDIDFVCRDEWND